jgi:hypothetical protein
MATLDVHLRQRQHQGSFTPQPLLQCFRVEPAFPHLRDRKGDAPYPGVDRLRLVTVGMPFSFFGMLVRFCLQVLLPFRLHCHMDDHLDQLRQNVKTLLAHPFHKFSG